MPHPRTAVPDTKHIFVTGGVASSLGKGLTASSLGQLLTARGMMPPVITRASEVGDERSRALFDGAYAEHARRVARAIDVQGGGD